MPEKVEEEASREREPRTWREGGRKDGVASRCTEPRHFRPEFRHVEWRGCIRAVGRFEDNADTDEQRGERSEGCTGTSHRARTLRSFVIPDGWSGSERGTRRQTRRGESTARAPRERERERVASCTGPRHRSKSRRIDFLYFTAALAGERGTAAVPGEGRRHWVANG